MSVFGVFLVRLFPHLDWIRRDTNMYIPPIESVFQIWSIFEKNNAWTLYADFTSVSHIFDEKTKTHTQACAFKEGAFCVYVDLHTWEIGCKKFTLALRVDL